MKYFFGFICLVFSAGPGVISQQPLYYAQYSTDQGLSENVVYNVVQDKKGFIWASTHHGLNRFDGYSFKKYYARREDSTSLSHNEIYVMRQDASGKLWIVTHSGLDLFDPETGKTKRIYYPGKLLDWGGSDIFFRGEDSVFILNTHMIFLYSKRDNKWRTYKINGEKPNLERFVQFADDNFGCINFSKGLLLFNSITNSFEKTDHIPGTRIPVDTNLSNYFTDKKGNHFVFGFRRQIAVYHTDGKLLAILDRKKFPSIKYPLYCVFSVSPSGDIWIATNHGLLLYRTQPKEFTEIELVGDSRSLKGNKEIRTLCIDKDENLWLGIFGEGLLKCEVKKNPFSSISLDLLARKDMPRMIFGLNRWPDGEIATESGFKNSAIIKKGKVTGFANADSMSYGKIIFITTGKKTGELTPAQVKITKKLYDEKNLHPSQFMIHDSHTVMLIAPRLVAVKTDTQYLFKGAYSTYTFDDGTYYWSAATDGLARVDKKNFTDTIYRHEPGNPFSLNENYIYHLVGDSAGNLWIGTKGGGLNFFNRNENRFYHFTTADGLPDDVIYFILPDKKGNLWLTTNRGLSRFNIRSGSFTNYSRRDGLLNSEFNRNGGLAMDDGTFYFTGTNGIDYFKPADLENTVSIPAVFISDIKINGTETVWPGVNKLKHFENNITVSFTANDFIRPDLVYYRYRLNDKANWTRVQGINFVSYNTLSSGSYEFYVQSSYDNYNWSEEAVYAFVIRMPWWKTAWFYLSLIFILTALLYAFYRYRINQLKKILNLRSRISQDLHDEVGATLSSIHVYSSVASMALEKDVTKAKDALQHINENTRQVMENMNDIVWAINTGQIGEATLEAKLKNYGYELLTPLNIQCAYRIDKEADRKIENLEARKNIMLIAKEAMNNIAKYSAASAVMIHLEIDNKKLLLEISDNGKGFDMEKKRNGNGLGNMRQRAEALNGNFDCLTGINKGTKIRCQIPVTSISD